MLTDKTFRLMWTDHTGMHSVVLQNEQTYQPLMSIAIAMQNMWSALELEITEIISIPAGPDAGVKYNTIYSWKQK